MNADRLSKIPLASDGQPLRAMVRIATNKAKVIPKDYGHLIPSEATAISSLLTTSLPTILSTASLLRPAKICVVCEEPSWAEDQFMSASVPSREWLKDLDEAIGEEWLKGANSIEYPSNPNIRFPLWAGTLWTALSNVIEEQKEWRRAREWINTLTQCRETHEVQAILEQIPRNIPIWILPTEADRAVTKITFFARLLSDGFLAERHIDAFVAYLNVQAHRRRPNSPGVFVADLPLSVVLSSYFNATKVKIRSCKLLLQYTAIFKNKAYRHLLFPAHVGGVHNGHWVVFSVNFERSEYSFGKLRDIQMV